MTEVLCDPNVVDAPLPETGLPWSVHSPRMSVAVAYCAGFGSHPVAPEVIR
ncbi:hypothetical protein D3C74_423750 [compost metagenome]